MDGFPLKRVFPCAKGLHIEFYDEIHAEAFYQKGLGFGDGWIEKLDRKTVIIKNSDAVLQHH